MSLFTVIQGALWRPRVLIGVVAVLLGACQAHQAPLEPTRAQLEARVPFHQIAATDFAPVYPALARQLVEDYGITEGVAVDVGSGSGHLGLALLDVTDLTVYALDPNPWALRLAWLLAYERELTGRLRTTQGVVEDLPFRDGFAQLVVSRGSIFFWDDQLAGLLECYRLLAPGGVAVVGGGFSRLLPPEQRAQLVREAQERFAVGKRPNGWRPLEPDLVERLKANGVDQASLIREPDVGWWIELRRPPDGPTDTTPKLEVGAGTE